MRRFISTTEEPAAAVNLTPMLDVVFIMLIFFIVTAVFVREQGLPVNPPDPANSVDPISADTVSYTHLTLPTIYSV